MKSFLIIAIVLLHILVSSDFADGYDPASSGVNDQCKGTNQSPIDFNTATDILLKSAFSFSNTNYFSITNGHSIKIQDLRSSQNIITVDGLTYWLQEVHFHTPSEHTINGYRYHAEAHFVFKNQYNRLSVIGVLYNAIPGGFSRFLNSIQSVYPPKGQTWTIMPQHNIIVDWAEVADSIAQNPWTYRYSGSLTTPPCTEGVTWFVANRIMSMSADQLNKLQQLTGNNARPTQPRNGRKVPS